MVTSIRRSQRFIVPVYWSMILIGIFALVAILAQDMPVVQARQLSAGIGDGLGESRVQVEARSQAEPAAPVLRFVDSANTPFAHAKIWVLCYADEQATSFVKAVVLSTDANGFAMQLLPSSCQWISALHREYEHPSGKAGHGPAYRIYAASWRTGSGTPEFDSVGCSYSEPNCIVTRPPSGDVVIRKEWPLVLFNIVASLEWTPEKGSNYVKEVQQGLKEASLYLADLTDGYMAFGSVAIYTGGRNWDGADLRFQTANDLRPAAFIGGIVDTPRLYTAAATAQAAILRPAATFYGRYWDGVDSHIGPWNKPDGYRTLVHEWAHYALFLYDEYDSLDRRVGTKATYCTCDDLPLLLNAGQTTVCSNVSRENGASAMAFHYSASELWHPIHGSPPSCVNSDQGHFHGETDWVMLSAWYKVQNLPSNLDLPALAIPAAPQPGPTTPLTTGPVADLFGRTDNFVMSLPFLRIPGVLLTPEAHTAKIDVKLSESGSPTETLITQVYLLQNDTNDKNQHNLHQGALTGAAGSSEIGEIELWGVTLDDSLHVFVDRYQTPGIEGGRFIYASPPTVEVQNLQAVVAERNSWGSNLDLVYSTTVGTGGVHGELSGMTVVLSGDHNTDYGKPPSAQICVPEDKLRCPSAWTKTMQMNSDGEWVTTFVPLSGTAELPLYGVVRIISDDKRVDNLFRWFRDAGGVGPGHKIGNAAPMRDGLVMVDRVDAPALEFECNRVMVMPAANYYALLTDMDAKTLVSMPLDIDILLGDAVEGQCKSTGISELEEFPGLRLTLFYPQEAIKRLGIGDESELSILQYVPTSEEWSVVASSVDVEMNRVSAKIAQDGIFAIGWYPSLP